MNFLSYFSSLRFYEHFSSRLLRLPDNAHFRYSSSLFLQNSLFSLRKLPSSSFVTEATDLKRFDILIVGGSMVGSSLAVALACTPMTSSLKIGIVESSFTRHSNSDNLQTFPHPQVISINTASMEFFQAIGIWNTILKTGRMAPFYDMQVWDANGPASIRFDNKKSETTNNESEALGFVIENNLLLRILHQRLQSFPSVEIICPSVVDSVVVDKERGDKWVEVLTRDGRKFSARLVVAADGTDSVVRNKLGISTFGWSYRQKAIVSTVEHSQKNTTAWQRFLPNGPIALLPMFGNYGVIVWSTTLSKAEELMILPESAFLEEILCAFQENIRPRGWDFNILLGEYMPPLPASFGSPFAPDIIGVHGNRGCFSLGLKHSKEYVRPRIALIGDAAHTVHPLAGQGVNLGLADAATLATVLIEGMGTGQDLGSLSLLQRYQQQRMLSNIVMMAGIDGLKRIFESSFFPIALARNVGISIANLLPTFKREIKKHAMGECVDVSRVGK